MTKKERKFLEEKIAAAVSETVKTNGLPSSEVFLKNVKKHAKAIAKKLLKELAVPEKKATTVVPKKAAVKRVTKAKKPATLPVKKATASSKK